LKHRNQWENIYDVNVSKLVVKKISGLEEKYDNFFKPKQVNEKKKKKTYIYVVTKRLFNIYIYIYIYMLPHLIGDFFLNNSASATTITQSGISSSAKLMVISER
jgi:hypothetical protein